MVPDSQGPGPWRCMGTWVHGGLEEPWGTLWAMGLWLSGSWGSKEKKELRGELGRSGPRPGAEGRAEKGGSGLGPFQAGDGWAPALDLREEPGRVAPGWVGALARSATPELFGPWALGGWERNPIANRPHRKPGPSTGRALAKGPAPRAKGPGAKGQYAISYILYPIPCSL